MVVLAIGRLASAVPVIKDFLSTDGHPSNKTNAKDLIYQAKQGDKITFSVTTDAACEHKWWTLKGSRALSTQVKQGVRQSSFTFIVPNEKANWDIMVEVSGPKATVGRTEKASKTWSITTSSLKTVNPGQSIQTAIDAGGPKSEYKNEQNPNGGRINMGAYGNTVKASKSATAEVSSRKERP